MAGDRVLRHIRDEREQNARLQEIEDELARLNSDEVEEVSQLHCHYYYYLFIIMNISTFFVFLFRFLIIMLYFHIFLYQDYRLFVCHAWEVAARLMLGTR